jgi:hypothetical protein
VTGGFAATLNRIALALALALFVALGAFWWRERTKRYEPPAWPHPAFVELNAPAAGAPPARWIVAVNPECGSCTARLAELRRLRAAEAAGAALGALLVDVRRRPDSLAALAGLGAGVWWDSAGDWRARWGHRTYGETMVFGEGGALERVLAPSEAVAPAAR